MYCSWSKTFLEAGGKRLAGKTARQLNSAEVKDLRGAALALMQLVADLSVENCLLKKNCAEIGGWGLRRHWFMAMPNANEIRCC